MRAKLRSLEKLRYAPKHCEQTLQELTIDPVTPDKNRSNDEQPARFERITSRKLLSLQRE